MEVPHLQSFLLRSERVVPSCSIVQAWVSPGMPRDVPNRARHFPYTSKCLFLLVSVSNDLQQFCGWKPARG